MEYGLTLKQVQEKKQRFGENSILTKSRSSPLILFASQFLSFINAILFGAAIGSFVIGDSIDAVFIVAILLLNAIVGFIQEYKAEQSLEKLKNYTTPSSRVIREGKEIQVPSSSLVPDDMVILSEGDRIPADGIFMESRHLEIDESILTGESLPVVKNQGETAFLGTLIVKGKGRLKITAIGMQTRFGIIAQTLATIKQDKTPLQKNLSILGKFISIIAGSFALFIIPIGLFQQKELIPLVILAVSIGVAAIPEGLPSVITIALALGTKRMAKQKAIVKTLPSVETLGSIQVILVDKTGTLTQNSMQVKHHVLHKENMLDSLLQACVLGNTASLIQKADSTRFDIVGDKTDGALLVWAKHVNPLLEDTLKAGKVVDEYVFDSLTKTITTVWEKDGRNYVFVRGAPEEILQKSRLSTHEKEEIEKQFQRFAKEGLRVIAFGTKETTSPLSRNRDHLEQDLLFLGFVGIYDPPRLEVKQALREAKKAGIRVVMVTGDNELTALAIAKEVGLIENDEDVVNGAELDSLSDDQLKQIINKTRIFARTKPQDKYRLVQLYKELGLVVGVTGDGVNDALALKKADVGVAMGQSGTDVAKEASDIVLTDDNFSTLVKAIEEGRTIYNNIVQSILYLLTGNLSEISLVFVATLIGLPPPLLPTQILWVNMVTDGLPALALASDNKNPYILNDPPRDPKTPILNIKRVKFIFFGGFGIALFLLIAFYLLLAFFDETISRTIIFNLLILIHLSIAFIVRKQSPFRANKFLLFSILITILFQIGITTIPFFQSLFHLKLP